MLDGTLIIAAVLAVAVVGGLVVVLYRQDRAARREHAEVTAATVAVLVDETRVTGLGHLCRWLLIGWNVLAAVMVAQGPRFVAGAEAVAMLPALLVWIAGNQVLIAGVMLGRRRDYRVLRFGCDSGGADAGAGLPPA